MMAGISAKALAFGEPGNNLKFNDASEFEHNEFSSGEGLNLYSTQFRGYDPQLGRFSQLDPLADISHIFSPYSYSNNNPIYFNDPTGLLSDSLHPIVMPEAIVKCKVAKKLDVENGQVYESRGFWGFIFGSPRKWEGHYQVDGPNGKIWFSRQYEVNNKGYLTGSIAPTIFEINMPVGFSSPINLKAIFRLKNFIKGEYSIYRGIKNGLPYFGKARGGINFRYTAQQIEAMEITAIEGLNKIPSNAIALGVEQLVIDLNGGVKAGVLANINNATVKEIYINEARYWLETNLPNWETLLKFK